MSLRIPLLLLSLLTLALPWAGCQYAQQMEAVQRKGQEEALLTTARILARVIATNDDLVEQFTTSANGDSASDVLFAAQLLTHPLLDGFADEWPHPARPLPISAQDQALQLGLYGGALYAFLRVTDPHVVYETPVNADSNDDKETSNTRHDASSPDKYDRVVLIAKDLTGVVQAWSISAVAPGPVIVRRAAVTAPWQAIDSQDDDLRGAWRATAAGYDMELRIPSRLVESEFAMVAINNAAPPPATIALHPLHTASETLREKLELYAPAGVRLSIVDAQGWLLARTGTLLTNTHPSSFFGDNDDRVNIYRRLLGTNEQAAPTYGLPYGMWGTPVDEARQGASSAIWFQAGGGEPSTVRAAVPIKSNGKLLGVLAVEQAAEQLENTRDAALAKLFNFALLALLFAVIFAIAFAAWLLRRIRRLSIAATTALSPEGRIEQRLPEMNSRDELGDLARSFANLLQRINEYANYLQTLGAKLSHEFRTPLAIVSSSLDNLAAEKNALQPQQQEFIDRARGGATRLQTILSAMTEATRVEQSIEHAEKIDFDLAELVRSAGNAYRQTFTSHRIEVQSPPNVCTLHGAPELIVQMLDKLIDNAVDFCPPGGLIALSLFEESKQLTLTVSNDGASLPKDIADRIFDLLVSNRTASADKPHLGLGLYIVQLIARFHGGQAAARNLSEPQSGVQFEIRLPRNT